MTCNEFGKKISVLRKQQKISQEQLAKDLSVSRATISALENGNGSNVGIKTILQIVDYLGFELTLVEKSPFPTFEELKRVDEFNNPKNRS